MSTPAAATAASSSTAPPPPPPPPPEDQPIGLVGPEAVSSQMSTDTVVGGVRRPSAAREDTWQERNFGALIAAMSVLMIGMGFGAEYCFGAKGPGPSGGRSSARSAGRPIAMGAAAASGSSQARASDGGASL
mmetsp:Transcript_60530/g.167737  ORF Transcript_60530/g.167737 Transcript_60530/m.167737 type:complete len:132 (-) Transcript_60530:197-592(-)